jgi:hypothetical protein
MISEMSARLSHEERLDLAISLLSSLKGSTSAVTPTMAPKAEKTKKPKDPEAPKKEATWWIKRTQYVREILKPLIDEHNASAEKKLAGTAPVRVASMLKDAGLLSEEMMPSDAQVQQYFKTFLTSPPEAKKAPSVASEASTDSKSAKKPRAEMTEEQKKAKREKAAATRAANKAKKEASPEPFTDLPWIHEGRSYLRVDNSLWDAATDEWVGEWNPVTKTIDTKAPEPTRVYE